MIVDYTANKNKARESGLKIVVCRSEKKAKKINGSNLYILVPSTELSEKVLLKIKHIFKTDKQS